MCFQSRILFFWTISVWRTGLLAYRLMCMLLQGERGPDVHNTTLGTFGPLSGFCSVGTALDMRWCDLILSSFRPESSTQGPSGLTLFSAQLSSVLFWAVLGHSPPPPQAPRSLHVCSLQCKRQGEFH